MLSFEEQLQFGDCHICPASVLLMEKCILSPIFWQRNVFAKETAPQFYSTNRAMLIQKCVGFFIMWVVSYDYYPNSFSMHDIQNQMQKKYWAQL